MTFCGSCGVWPGSSEVQELRQRGVQGEISCCTVTDEEILGNHSLMCFTKKLCCGLGNCSPLLTPWKAYTEFSTKLFNFHHYSSNFQLKSSLECLRRLTCYRNSWICDVTFDSLFNVRYCTFQFLPTASFSLLTLRPCQLTLR